MISLVSEAEKLLADLVSFPSTAGQSNAEIINYIKSYLENLNVDVWLDANKDGKRFNLFATFGKGKIDGIILSGHTDVVPASENEWDSHPFILTKINQNLIGRGAVDMKGFLAITLAMAPYFKKFEDKLKNPIHFAFTFDEELGTFGASQILEFFKNEGIKPKIAIVGEPTGMVPLVGHKGGLEMITEIKGSSGHSSDPRGKVNSLYYAAKLISFIEKVNNDLSLSINKVTPFNPPYSSLSVGYIKGGQARNIVPNYCYFDWEIRPLPEDDPYLILSKIKNYASKILEPEMKKVFEDSEIKMTEVSFCPPMEARFDSPALDLIKKLWKFNKPSVASYGTDGGHFQSIDIETIVFGPGEMKYMHQPNESIKVSEIEEGLIFLKNLCSYLKINKI